MNLVGCIPRFLKAHGGWVLTALSAAGFIGTTVLVANEAPKVREELDRETNMKIHRQIDIYMDEEEADGKDPESWSDDEHEELYFRAEQEAGQLTFAEKLEIAVPIYLPAILTGGLTIGCMIGAQIFNAKQQAALVAAYALLGQEFSEYRKAIIKEYGEEADKKAFEIAKEETKKLRAELEKMKAESGPFLYTIATLPGVVFESTPKDIYESLYHFNRNMNLGRGSISNLYEMIGLPCSLFNDVDGWSDTSAGDYGWDTYENEITYGNPEGAFRINKVGQKNGTPIYLIDFDVPPYKLGLDYGMDDSSIDYRYEWYCPEEATRLAVAVSDDEIVRFEPPERYVMPMF